MQVYGTPIAMMGAVAGVVCPNIAGVARLEILKAEETLNAEVITISANDFSIKFYTLVK